MKGKIIILKIRRIEVEALRKAGYGNYVKHSYSRKPTYYVVEDKKVLRVLREFQESIKVK